MALKQTIEIYELLDRADASGDMVADLLRQRGLTDVSVRRVEGADNHTDFLKITIAGKGSGRTLGIVGRLGGVGARPKRIGLVSDADGAIAALATALKLADMHSAGDVLHGDVIITTHVCPSAPTIRHEPVELMYSPVDVHELISLEVDEAMQAIVSIDATKANDIVNWKGLAITPTVKQGYVLRVSPGLAQLFTSVTGQHTRVVPITTQDITPHGNGIYHINSMMQPSTRTRAPVVGLATVAEAAVPGSATGASHVIDLEMAVRYCVEVAKAFTGGSLEFYNASEWSRLVELYGSLDHLQQREHADKPPSTRVER